MHTCKINTLFSLGQATFSLTLSNKSASIYGQGNHNSQFPRVYTWLFQRHRKQFPVALCTRLQGDFCGHPTRVCRALRYYVSVNPYSSSLRCVNLFILLSLQKESQRSNLSDLVPAWPQDPSKHWEGELIPFLMVGGGIEAHVCSSFLSNVSHQFFASLTPKCFLIVHQMHLQCSGGSIFPSLCVTPQTSPPATVSPHSGPSSAQSPECP